MEAGRVPCPSGRYYRVKVGDTLYKISVRERISLDRLIRLNPGIDINNLQIGQEICLPPKLVCPSNIYWEVVKGDTFSSIARATGTTVERLRELNPGVEPRELQIGQVICLPE